MEKKKLRALYRQERCALSSERTDLLNIALFSKAIALLTELKPKTIHLFLPQAGAAEPYTPRIIKSLQAQSSAIRIAIPYIIPGTKTLQHFLFDNHTELIANQWGIMEPNPKSSIAVQPKEIDSVFLPLLAFDKNGYRVGYGGGFYDRFLAECKPETIKIGLSMFEPVDVISDLNKWDVRMDYCVTPLEVYHW